MAHPVTALAWAAALVLALFFLFGPGRSLYAHWRRGLGARRRILIEDALKHLYHAEADAVPATLDSLSGALEIPRDRAADLAARLHKLGMLAPAAAGYQLTPAGRREALRVIRIHRLWEKYLADQTGLDETRWHDEADRREHALSPAAVDALEAALGHPRFDPHGDPIPTAAGDMPPSRGQPLTRLAAGQSATVSHVEDEPNAVYAQLVAQGLTVGTRLRVLEASPDRLRLEVEGDEHVLAPVVAANVTVVPDRDPPRAAVRTVRLSAIPLGESARVVALAPACRGPERRRLLDLGLVPGTVIAGELAGGGGDPVAYRIRGALIALRRSQADHVLVEPLTRAALAPPGVPA